MAGQPILGHESATEVTRRRTLRRPERALCCPIVLPLSFHRISSFLRTTPACMILGVDLQPERACLILNVI